MVSPHHVSLILKPHLTSLVDKNPLVGIETIDSGAQSYHCYLPFLAIFEFSVVFQNHSLFEVSVLLAYAVECINRDWLARLLLEQDS